MNIAVDIIEKHRMAYGVRYYEIGDAGVLKPRVLLDYLQDSAARHAALLGVGMEALSKRQVTWVLSRLLLLVDRYPGPGETLTVETWPSSRERASSHREFEVFDAAGVPVARARTQWAMVDVGSGRPVRLDATVPAFRLLERRAIEEDFPALAEVGEASFEERFTVRRDDLDVNRHLNNAVFIAWALESAPAELVGSLRPARIDVAFRAEALAGEAVLARCAPDEGAAGLRHALVRGRDGRELARLRTRWA